MGLKGTGLLDSFSLIAEDTRNGVSESAQNAFNRIAKDSDHPNIADYAAKHGYTL